MDYAPAIWSASPNFNAGDYPKSYINDHWTVAYWDSALRTLTTQRFDADGENISVSAQYLVGRDGRVAQLVRETDRAWHNGMPGWNEKAIGIEHEHLQGQDWPVAQLAASAALHADISARNGIPLDREHVLGHRETGYNTACPGDLPIDQILALTEEDMTLRAEFEAYKKTNDGTIDAMKRTYDRLYHHVHVGASHPTGAETQTGEPLFPPRPDAVYAGGSEDGSQTFWECPDGTFRNQDDVVVPRPIV